jgi:hypothetical protein
MKPDEVFDNLPTIIVTRGLLPTDRVVAQGLMRTRPGMKVEPHLTTVDANTNRLRPLSCACHISS